MFGNNNSKSGTGHNLFGNNSVPVNPFPSKEAQQSLKGLVSSAIFNNSDINSHEEQTQPPKVNLFSGGKHSLFGNRSSKEQSVAGNIFGGKPGNEGCPDAQKASKSQLFGFINKCQKCQTNLRVQCLRCLKAELNKQNSNLLQEYAIRNAKLQLQVKNLRQHIAKRGGVADHSDRIQNLTLENISLKDQLRILKTNLAEQEKKSYQQIDRLKKEQMTLFKEENMKKWMEIQDWAKNLNNFIEQTINQLPDRQPLLRQLVSEGEKRVISAIDEKMMEMPSNISKMLEELTVVKQTELKKCKQTSKNFEEFIRKEKDAFETLGQEPISFPGKTFEDMINLLRQNTTSQVEGYLSKITKVENSLSKLKGIHFGNAQKLK